MNFKKVVFFFIALISLENRKCRSSCIEIEFNDYHPNSTYSTIEDFKKNYDIIKNSSILNVTFRDIPIRTEKEIYFLTQITEDLTSEKTRIFFALSELEEKISLSLFKFMNAHNNIEIDLRNLELEKFILNNNETLKELKKYFENFLCKKDFVSSLGFKLLLNPKTLLNIADEFTKRANYNSTAIACYKYACAFGISEALLKLGEFLPSKSIDIEEYEREIDNFIHNSQDENLENAKILLNQYKGPDNIRQLLEAHFPPKNEKDKFVLASTYRKLFYLLGKEFKNEFSYLRDRGEFKSMDKELLDQKKGLELEYYIQDSLRDQAIIYYKEIITNQNSPYWDLSNIYLSVALLQNFKYKFSECSLTKDILNHLNPVIDKNNFYSFRARCHRAQFYRMQEKYIEAKKDYEFLAHKGHSYAQFELGRIYINRFTKENNFNHLTKGLQLYQQAAINGNQYAQFALGKILNERKVGRIENIDLKLLAQSKINTDRSWMRELAERGNHWAKHYLYFYFKEKFYSFYIIKEKEKFFIENISPLIEDFIKYVKKHKHSSILDDIGHFYLNYSQYDYLGLDKKESLQKAEKYFKQAISLDGNLNSKLNLANLYTEKDFKSNNSLLKEILTLLGEVLVKLDKKSKKIKRWIDIYNKIKPDAKFRKEDKNSLLKNFLLITEEILNKNLENQDENFQRKAKNKFLLYVYNTIIVNKKLSQEDREFLSHFIFPQELEEISDPIYSIYGQENIRFMLAYAAKYGNALAHYFLYDLIKSYDSEENDFPLKNIKSFFKKKFNYFLSDSKVDSYIKGRIYFYLNNLEKSKEEFKKSEQEENKKSTYWLGILESDEDTQREKYKESFGNGDNYKYPLLDIARVAPEDKDAFDKFIEAGNKYNLAEGFYEAAKMILDGYNDSNDPIDLLAKAGDLGMLSAYNFAAEICFKRKDIEKAKIFYEKQGKAGDLKGWYDLARVLESEEKFDKAKDYYKKSGPLIGYFDAARLGLNGDKLIQEAQKYYDEHFIKLKKIVESQV